MILLLYSCKHVVTVVTLHRICLVPDMDTGITNIHVNEENTQNPVLCTPEANRSVLPRMHASGVSTQAWYK
jgi:hypothetical protein